MDSKQVTRLFESLDIDKNGTISFSELCTAFIDFSEISESKLKQAFDYFDKDQNGYISIQEMCLHFKDAEKIMKKYHFSDSDAKIYFDDFKAIIKS